MKKSSKGLTLIELVLAMAILGIVLIIAMGLNLFGTQSFIKGERQYSVQADVRSASDFISGELRNAFVLSLTEPANPGDYYQIYVVGKKITYQEPSLAAVDKSGSIIQFPADFIVSVNSENNKYFVAFTINGNYADENSQIESKVFLNNISDSVTGASNRIYYKKVFETAITTSTSTTESTSIETSATTSASTTVPLTYDFIFNFNKNNGISIKFWKTGTTEPAAVPVAGNRIEFLGMAPGEYSFIATRPPKIAQSQIKTTDAITATITVNVVLE